MTLRRLVLRSDSLENVPLNRHRKWLWRIIILSSIVGAPFAHSPFTFYREDCLKGLSSRKINIIFLRGPLFFRPFFLGRPALTSSHPSPTAFRVPGRMIAMSSQADEVRLERFNIVLTSIRYRGRGNPLTRWHCKPYQFNFMRTLSRTLRSPAQYSGRLS